MKNGLIVLLFLFSSCATIVNEKYESVWVKTNPPGARIVTNNHECASPCELVLIRGDDYLLEISKDGYQSKKIKLDGMSFDAPMLGNILVGGIIIGIIIDILTNRGYDFAPESVDFSLIPRQGNSRSVASKTVVSPTSIRIRKVSEKRELIRFVIPDKIKLKKGYFLKPYTLDSGDSDEGECFFKIKKIKGNYGIAQAEPCFDMDKLKNGMPLEFMKD